MMNRKDLIDSLMNYSDCSNINSEEFDVKYAEKILTSGLIPYMEWVDYQLVKLNLYKKHNKKAYEICSKYENSSNKFLLSQLSTLYKDGIGTEPNYERYKYILKKCVDSGATWKVPEYIDILLEENTKDNLNEIIKLGEENCEKYPQLIYKIALARFLRGGGVEDKEETLQSIIKCINHNLPQSKKLLADYAYRYGIDSQAAIQLCGFSVNNSDTQLLIKCEDNFLELSLVSKKTSFAELTIFKDFIAIYRTQIDSTKNVFYPLESNGIYYGLSKLTTGEEIHSHCIEYFDESLKHEYAALIEHNDSDNITMPFVTSNEPFYDFLFSNVEITGDFFNHFNKVKNKNGYVYTTSKIYSNKFISSGVGIHNNKYIKSNGNTYYSEEDIGCFTCIDYSDSIKIYTDYFGKGKIFYYINDNQLIVSNRYHLLAIAIASVDQSFIIDYEVCFSHYNSYVDSLNLQPVNGHLLIKNTFLLPNGEYLEIIDGCLKNKKTSYVHNFKSTILSNQEYIEKLDAAIEELKSNLEIVLNSGYYDGCIIDITGGIDSRIVLEILNKCKTNLQIIPLTRAINKNDTKIAITLANESGYAYNHSLTSMFNNVCTTKKIRNISEHEYLQSITSLSLESFDPNSIVPLFKMDRILHIGGYDGESFTRPYLSVGLGWLMSDESPKEISARYVESTTSKSFTAYEKTSKYFEKGLEESLSKFNGSSCSVFEQIYPNYRARFHFDPFIHDSISTDYWIPFMSKKLFNLHWSTLDQKPLFSFAFDLTERIDNKMCTLSYAGEMDDLLRVASSPYMINPDVKQSKIKDDTKRAGHLDTKGIIEINGVDMEIECFSESLPITEDDVFNLLISVSKKSTEFRESLGLPVYYFIKYGSKSKGVYKYKSSLFYLYKKLALLDTVINLKDGNIPEKTDIKRVNPLNVSLADNKIIVNPGSDINAIVEYGTTNID